MWRCMLPPTLDFGFGPRPHASTKILSYSIKRLSIKLVRKTVNSDCWFIHVCLSVRQFAWNKSAPTGRIFTKFHISEFFLKSVEKIQASLKSEKNSGYVTWGSVYSYDNVSVLSYQNEKCFRHMFVEKMKTHFRFNFFLQKSCRLWRKRDKIW